MCQLSPCRFNSTKVGQRTCEALAGVVDVIDAIDGRVVSEPRDLFHARKQRDRLGHAAQRVRVEDEELHGTQVTEKRILLNLFKPLEPTAPTSSKYGL